MVMSTGFVARGESERFMVVDLLLFVLVIVISGVVFVPLHAITVRAMRGRNLLTAVNVAIIAAGIVGGAAGWLLFGGLFSGEASKGVACIGGGIAFLGFGGVYNLLGPTSVDRSVSVHLVSLINQAPGNRLNREDLFRYYTHADVLEKRFVECAQVGVIHRDGEQLTLTPGGRRIAAIYAAIGRLLGMHPWYLDRYRDR